MNHSYIDIFIKNKYDEIPEGCEENVKKLLPFYFDIPSAKLADLFSYLHYQINQSFDFMNYKISTNHHYNAENSRELISIIDLYEKLHNALKDSKYAFKLDNEYLEIIDVCNTFLEGSGGSAIPDNLEKNWHY